MQKRIKKYISVDGASVKQSEFEVITYIQRTARENARIKLVSGLGFASHW